MFAELFRKSIQRWAASAREPVAIARLRARAGHVQRRLEALAAALDGRLRIWVAFSRGRPVTEALLAEPVRLLRNVIGQAADELGSAMVADLDGVTSRRGWCHGDLCVANAIFDGGTTRVVGLIDWEAARPDGLVDIDKVLLELTTRALVSNRDLDAVVVSELRSDGAGPEGALSRRSAVLLAWLHHVGANLRKSAQYERSSIWLDRNVRSVTATIVSSSP